jgi:hypothetical protein
MAAGTALEGRLSLAALRKDFPLRLMLMLMSMSCTFGRAVLSILTATIPMMREDWQGRLVLRTHHASITVLKKNNLM